MEAGGEGGDDSDREFSGGNQHRGVRGISILHVQGASNNAMIFVNFDEQKSLEDTELKTKILRSSLKSVMC